MRRIAFVCDWYSPRLGGIETHLDGLATRLQARGDEVHVITSTPGEPTVNGIRVHRLGLPRLPLAHVAIAPAAWPIQEILIRERIDVVHSHVSIVAPVALAGGLAADRAELPSVITFHSFVPATPILAGAAGLLMGASRWPAVFSAVSRRVAGEISGFAPDAPIELLPNAIDTSFWKPDTDAARRKSGVRLVYAGRLQAKKRPRLLLRVLESLEALASTHSFSLKIIGTGQLEARMKSEVAKSPLRDRVEFAGWLSPERLRDELRSADVFLSTATRESFGLAALEARAVGVPVVAMRHSAVADFIAHGVSGLLAADDAEFARATVRLVKDGELRRRIADNNATTEVPFDWERSMERHSAIYDRAVRLAARPRD